MANTIKTIILVTLTSLCYACGGEDEINNDVIPEETPEEVIVEETPELDCDVFEECFTYTHTGHIEVCEDEEGNPFESCMSDGEGGLGCWYYCKFEVAYTTETVCHFTTNDVECPEWTPTPQLGEAKE